MKYSGRITRWYPVGFRRVARNRGIDSDHFFRSLRLTRPKDNNRLKL